MDCIFDDYDLESLHNEVSDGLHRYISSYESYEAIVSIVSSMKSYDGVSLESFYNRLSIEDGDEKDEKKGSKSNGSGNNNPGVLKKIWIAIKNFFRKIKEFVSGVIRKIRREIAIAKNKHWTKKCKNVLNSDIPKDYNKFVDKLGKKSDEFIARSFSVYFCNEKHSSFMSFSWGPIYDRLLESFESLVRFLTGVIDQHDNNDFSYVEGTKEMTNGMISLFDYVIQMTKCKSIKDINDSTKKYMEKYNESAKQFERWFDNPKHDVKSKIHREALKLMISFHKDIKNALEKDLKGDSGSPKDWFDRLIKNGSVVETFAYRDTSKVLVNFLQKTDGHGSKISGALNKAEQQGKKNAIPVINDFMKLYQKCTSLAFSQLNALIGYKRLLFKEVKEDIKHGGVVRGMKLKGAKVLRRNSKRTHAIGKKIKGERNYDNHNFDKK